MRPRSCTSSTDASTRGSTMPTSKPLRPALRSPARNDERRVDAALHVRLLDSSVPEGVRARGAAPGDPPRPRGALSVGHDGAHRKHARPRARVTPERSRSPPRPCRSHARAARYGERQRSGQCLPNPTPLPHSPARSSPSSATRCATTSVASPSTSRRSTSGSGRARPTAQLIIARAAQASSSGSRFSTSTSSTTAEGRGSTAAMPAARREPSRHVVPAPVWSAPARESGRGGRVTSAAPKKNRA